MHAISGGIERGTTESALSRTQRVFRVSTGPVVSEKPLVRTHSFSARAAHIALTAGLAIGARDLIAGFDAGHGLAHGDDVAGHFMAGHERKLDTIAVCAVAHQKIMKAHATSANANEDLIALRLRRRRIVLDPQYFGPANAALDHCPHCFPHYRSSFSKHAQKLVASFRKSSVCSPGRGANPGTGSIPSKSQGGADARNVPASRISMSRRCPRRQVSRCATTS